MTTCVTSGASTFAAAERLPRRRREERRERTARTPSLRAGGGATGAVHPPLPDVHDPRRRVPAQRGRCAASIDGRRGEGRMDDAPCAAVEPGLSDEEVAYLVLQSSPDRRDGGTQAQDAGGHASPRNPCPHGRGPGWTFRSLGQGTSMMFSASGRASLRTPEPWASSSLPVSSSISPMRVNSSISYGTLSDEKISGVRHYLEVQVRGGGVSGVAEQGDLRPLRRDHPPSPATSRVRGGSRRRRAPGRSRSRRRCRPGWRA